MYESYYDSAEGETIKLSRAIQEVKAHDASTTDFFAECGYRGHYDAQAVLNWLGY